MDDANRGMCYALRHPGNGKTPMKFKDIRKLVKKKNNKRPTIGAIQQAAANFRNTKKKRGRKPKSRATTKAEDKEILQTFHRMRPPGHYVDSRIVHSNLTPALKRKIGRRTVIRRVNEKGYYDDKKMAKTDLGVKVMKKRLVFCRKHRDKDSRAWNAHLQAAGDMKLFSFYPKALQPTFKRLRASHTYMSKAERLKPAFQRPKHWFPKKQYQKVKKVKVFGFTASTGAQLNFLVPTPWDSAVWAKLVKSKLVPWLKKIFPNRTSYNILLDGEKLLHAPEAKAAYRKFNITIEPAWPGYSPEFNPQENIWARAEPELRKLETGRDSFPVWQKKMLKACDNIPGADKLIGSMAKRIEQCIQNKGGMITY